MTQLNVTKERSYHFTILTDQVILPGVGEGGGGPLFPWINRLP